MPSRQGPLSLIPALASVAFVAGLSLIITGAAAWLTGEPTPVRHEDVTEARAGHRSGAGSLGGRRAEIWARVPDASTARGARTAVEGLAQLAVADDKLMMTELLRLVRVRSSCRLKLHREAVAYGHEEAELRNRRDLVATLRDEDRIDHVASTELPAATGRVDATFPEGVTAKATKVAVVLGVYCGDAPVPK